MSPFSLLSAEYARTNNGLTEMKSIIRIPITITINIKHRGSQEWLWLSTDITIIQTIGTCSMATKDSNCHLHYCHHLHHHSDLKHGNQRFQLPSSSLSSPSPSFQPQGPEGWPPDFNCHHHHYHHLHHHPNHMDLKDANQRFQLPSSPPQP